MSNWAKITERFTRRTLHVSGSPAQALCGLCLLAFWIGCAGHNPWTSSTAVVVEQVPPPPAVRLPGPDVGTRQPVANQPLSAPAIAPGLPIQRVGYVSSSAPEALPVQVEGASTSSPITLAEPQPEVSLSKFLPAIPEAWQDLANPTPGPLELAVAPAPLPPDAVRSEQDLVTISVRDTPLHSLLAAIAEQQGLSIIAPASLNVNVTVSLRPTTLENALDAIMAISNCTWSRHQDVIYVTAVDKEQPQNFLAQGRVLKVFNLSYISAKDVEIVVRGLISPVGSVFAQESVNNNKLKAVEQLVVEDLPTYVARVADYVSQVDQPPKQVAVEVRILQIKLGKDDVHGINLEQLARGAGPEVWLKTQTFSSDQNPGAIFTVGGTRFNQVLDMLVSTLDAKTLASPKLMMINGQESRIQIGSRLAFSTATTTQTVTVEAVQFLDVGTVLSVTPQIGDQGQVLLTLNPKVSQGEIDPVTKLPNEDTTELNTTIMVPDGHGVIIGGLIQESDIERQSKVPWLGDLWLVGRLFQRRTVNRERTEVVVALLPRIIDCHNSPTSEEFQDLQRVDMPVLTPDLQSAPRPEPRLPDAVKQPVWPKRAAQYR